MPATLNGLYGDNLFDALVALRLPAVAPENVHLEVALAAQRLAQQDSIDIITHVDAQIVHKDYYMEEEEDRTLAFLDRRATLDGIVQKHVELAANAAACHTSVGNPAHQGMMMSLMDPYVFSSFRQIHVVVYDTTVIILPFTSTSYFLYVLHA